MSAPVSQRDGIDILHVGIERSEKEDLQQRGVLRSVVMRLTIEDDEPGVRSLVRFYPKSEDNTGFGRVPFVVAVGSCVYSAAQPFIPAHEISARGLCVAQGKIGGIMLKKEILSDDASAGDIVRFFETVLQYAKPVTN